MTPLLAVALAPLLLAAADEKSFFHFPGAGDFRWQAIERTGNEKAWPFTANRGWLSCAYVLGQRTGYFIEATGDRNESEPRIVVISTDAFNLSLSNLGRTELFDRSVGLEELLRRISPYVQTAHRLCDQPPGTEVRPGEL